jgi:DNA mismatch repair ATPase MutS
VPAAVQKQVVVLDAAVAARQLEGEWEAAWGDLEEVEQQVAATTKLVALFNSEAATWDCLTAALSALDALASFAAFAATADGPTCRPELVQQGAALAAASQHGVHQRGVAHGWHPLKPPSRAAHQLCRTATWRRWGGVGG